LAHNEGVFKSNSNIINILTFKSKIMKSLFFALFATVFSLQLMGQSIITKHYQSLENEENATVVFVSGNLFGYVAKVMPEEKEEMQKAKGILENIESFNLISVPDLSDPKSEYNKGLKTLRATHEDLISIRDKNNNFSFFIDEEDGIIRELVGIGTEENSFMVFSLLGSIDVEELSVITDMIQDKKSLPIGKEKTKAITEFKVYPNPVANTSILNVEVPDDLVGGKINVIDLSGKIVKTVNADQERVEVSMLEASLGSYIIDIVKDEVSMRKQVLVIE
jgi:hypothetical protein